MFESPTMDTGVTRQRRHGSQPCGLAEQLQLLLAFDGLMLSLGGVLVLIYMTPVMMTVPGFLLRFMYLAPLLSLVYFTFRLPVCGDRAIWGSTVWRLRCSALVLAGLSPFWGWWQIALQSRYCLYNVGLLALVACFYLFNLIGLSRMVADARGYLWLSRLARLARLMVIYGLFAPVLAFFGTVWYGNNSGYDILVFIQKLSLWHLYLLGMPVVLLLVILSGFRRVPLPGSPLSNGGEEL